MILLVGWATHDVYKSFGKKLSEHFLWMEISKNVVNKISLANIFTACLFSLFKAGGVELMKKPAKSTYSIIGFDI